MRLLVTRPQPDADRQAAELRARGYEVLLQPLLAVEFLDAGRLEVDDVQAIVATSRNGLRALARNEALQAALGKPLYTVGEATAAMAQSLGFAEVFAGQADAAALAGLLRDRCRPEAGALLHLAGERLAGDLKGELDSVGFEVRQPVLYRTVPAEGLSGEVARALASGALDAVLLMSPRTAQVWATLVADPALAEPATRVCHLCLSAAVAEALAGLPAARIRIADAPREDALLALIARETAH